MRSRCRYAFLAVLLLATPAVALTVSETPFPGATVVGDYGDDFAGRTTLPAETDLVRGSVSFFFDGFSVVSDADFFALSDLLPGATVTLTLEKLSNGPVDFTVFDEGGATLIAAFTLPGEQGAVPPTVVSATVPGSGEVVIRVRPGDGTVPYVVAVDAERVPEPAAGLLLGLGIVVSARRRRR